MPKRKKTRQEKIILQLKKELLRKERISTFSSIKSKPRQEAISQQPQIESELKSTVKKTDKSIFSYDPNPIRQDLFKTFLLSLIILSFEFVLYWKLR